MRIYDILYAYVARDGRDGALFGDGFPYSRLAFEMSCPGDAFPEIWFELPLKGEPWFDFHALTGVETLDPGMEFAPERTGGYPGVFKWFADAQGVRQLALSWDLHKGDLSHPALQLLVRDSTMHVPFLELAGGAGAVSSYRAFETRAPRHWLPCYTGLFPGRDDFGVRVECIPGDGWQKRYAADAELLESDLRQTGLPFLSESIISRCHELARTPFALEFQFDVRPDGTTGETFSASVRFDNPDAPDASAPFDVGGAAGELMEQIESWGLADGRWRLLADAMVSKRVERENESMVMGCYPAFIKLRWHRGEPLDAKAYLIGLFEKKEILVQQ